MCESNAYSTDGSILMEDVISIKIEGEDIHMVDILNQRKDLKGTIVEIDLDAHKIYIKIN
ncbi:CooT family nickel-binding protein [Methanobacterium alcaliphilum]|uniref:CooT family nickel-binding protein n=1 Tax=Methanobacterium alcaliphilum TaxID=392018 RepID=UPI00200AD94F|nr:CooT family nickel-binding protein [Methanobacterium alcaliphilum]MCK9150583.1 CooT family nickel-binding protein [Methanobacterium alcaliphilum]